MAACLFLVMLAFGAVLWVGNSAGRKPSLPPLGSLAHEGLGTGVRIGMALADARTASEIAAFPVVFTTAEDLATRDLYKERSAKSDLLGVIYGSDVLDPGERVRGLRCYLSPPKLSKATLAGQPAAPLSPDKVQELFGKPFSSSASGDGRTHLVYYFAEEGDKANTAYKLTTSHEFDGHIFSMALERVLAPR